MKNIFLELAAVLLLFSNGVSYAQCSFNPSFSYTQSGNEITFTNTSTGTTPVDNISWNFNNQFTYDSSPTMLLTGAMYGEIMCMALYNNTLGCSDSICIPVYFDTTQSVPCNLVVDFDFVDLGGAVNLTNMSTGFLTGSTHLWTYGSQNDLSYNASFSTYGVPDGTLACLYVNDSTGLCADSYCQPIVYDTSLSSGCSINLNFTTLQNGNNITFTNTSGGVSGSYSIQWAYNGQLSNTPVTTLSLVGASYGDSVTIWIYDQLTFCSQSASFPVYFDTTQTFNCTGILDFDFTQSGDSITIVNNSSGIIPGSVYNWSFNGQTATGPTPTFSVLGAVMPSSLISVTVTDTTGSCVLVTSFYPFYNTVQTSTCDLNMNLSYVQSGNLITFNNTSTGVPVSGQFNWYFNGQSASGPNPTFSLNGAANGQLVSFYISNAGYTCYDSLFVPVLFDTSMIVPCNLSMDFSYIQNANAMTFTNLSSSIPVGASFIWNYDGQISYDSIPVFSLTSIADSSYMCLTIIDSSGVCSGSYCNQVFFDTTQFVGCNMSLNYQAYVSGDSLIVTDLSTGIPLNMIYEWTYYGQNSAMQNPVFSLSGVPQGSQLCLHIYDSLLTCEETYCTPIYFTTSCNAMLDYSYTQVGDTIVITNNSTAIPSGATIYWYYNGQYSNAFNPQFSLIGATSGDIIELYVWDPVISCEDSLDIPVYFDSTLFSSITPSFLYLQTGSNISFTNTTTDQQSGWKTMWEYNGQVSYDPSPVLSTIGAQNGDQMCLTIYDSLWSFLGITCDSVFLNSFSAVEPDLENSFSFYPNPVDDQLFITLNGGLDQVLIFSVTGEMVRRENISAQQVTMDVSGLPSGLYFITVYSDDNPDLILSEKFIKR